MYLIIAATSGCDSNDGRLARYAERSNELQAMQNELTAKQSQIVAQQGTQIADAARELVKQDAAARHVLIKAHEQARAELQDERTGLDEKREKLEQERKGVAAARQRDPIVAEAIGGAALILAALLPLLLACYALRQVGTSSTDTIVQELLVRELVETTTLPVSQPNGIPEQVQAERRALPPTQTEGTN